MGTSRLKKGNQNWLTGHLRSTAKIYDFETKTYEALLTYAEKMATGPKIDLLEVFAGSANLTFRAPKFNLNALEPMDKTINVDLKTAEGRKFLWQVVKRFKPSKSGANMWCFVHFDLEMCFAPQRRALFRHLNLQKWSENGVFCTF